MLDDVWSADVTQLEPGPGCSVLYTSRLQFLRGVAAKQCSRVEKFTDGECEELFHTGLDSTFGANEVSRNHDALLNFCIQVEMLPIAVTVGVNLLREKAAITLDRSIKRLRPEALTDGVRDVRDLFRKAIEAQPRREQRLLAACAVCVQEGFWLPLAARIADLSTEEAEDAAICLVQGSLLRVVNRARQRFQMHSLLRESVRAALSESSISDLQDRHTCAVEHLFKHWEAAPENCRESLHEIIPAVQYLWKKTPKETWLTSCSFALCQRIGELDTGIRILKHEESLWSSREDREAKRVLQRNFGNQAQILFGWGHLDEAFALHKRQEAICLELDESVGLAHSYLCQALILRCQGRLDEAVALLQSQQDICIKMKYEHGLQRSFGAQALIMQDRGCLEEALALHKEQESICLRLPNKEGLYKSYSGQGVVLRELGHLEDALTMFKKEEQICLEIGDQDGLQCSYGNQASILRLRGHFEEALALYRGKEAICEQLGYRSSLAYCYWHWGLLARAQDDCETEKRKLEQALAIFTELKMPRERDQVQAELERTSGSS